MLVARHIYVSNSKDLRLYASAADYSYIIWCSTIDCGIIGQAEMSPLLYKLMEQSSVPNRVHVVIELESFGLCTSNLSISH